MQDGRKQEAHLEAKPGAGSPPPESDDRSTQSAGGKRQPRLSQLSHGAG